MPHVSRTAKQRLGIAAVALAALLSPAGAPRASDLYQPYGPPPGVYAPPPVVGPPVVHAPPPVVASPPVVYGEPRYVPPVIDRRVEVDDGGCRIIHRRRIDPYGREIVRRVRVCDEAVVEPYRRWAGPAPRYGYDPYYGAPRPPRAVRPDPDDDLD
jgi:hypothetical protein